MIKVAFDVGGVLSKYPEIFRALIRKLTQGNVGQVVEVHVISDMHPKEKIIELLKLNEFIVEDDGDSWPMNHHLGMIQKQNVHSADYDTHCEGSKTLLLEELGIDMFFDDFIGYLAPGGAPVRLLVMPDHEKPYYADSWKMPPGEPEFGRRRFTKRQTKGRDT
jgi:hypothetical protein